MTRIQLGSGAALLSVAYVWLSGNYTHNIPMVALIEFVLTGLFSGFLVERTISILTPPPNYMLIAAHVLIVGFLLYIVLPYGVYWTVNLRILPRSDPFMLFGWSIVRLVGANHSIF